MDGLSLKEWQQAVPVLKHSKQRSVTIYSPLATVSPWVRMTKDGAFVPRHAAPPYDDALSPGRA
jgi:hypothetical protein